jgi:rhodanese-related sulfurtransferase
MDISAAEFWARYKDGSIIVIDVREEFEFQTANFGGINIPLGKLIREVGVLTYGKQEAIVVVCQHGIRSETARKLLVKNGYQNVRNLMGGILAVRKLNIIHR